MPALLTRPSRRPCVRPISAIAAFQSSSLVTSSAMSTLPRAARSLRIGLPPAASIALHMARAQRAERAGDEHDVVFELQHSSRTLSIASALADRAAYAERGVEHHEVHEAVSEQLDARPPASTIWSDDCRPPPRRRRLRHPPVVQPVAQVAARAAPTRTQHPPGRRASRRLRCSRSRRGGPCPRRSARRRRCPRP